MAQPTIHAWEKLHQKQEFFNNSVINNVDFVDSYLFIYDCIDNKMLFTNNAFVSLTGFEAAELTINKLISMIHPDDLSYFFECEEKGLQFTNKLSFSEHFQYFFSYSYRIVTATGDLITIRQQCQAIEVTPQGHLSKTLVVHKKVDNYKKRPDNDYKIFDKRVNSYINLDNCFNLTKREMEIVDLVREGMSSPEIAEKLFISKLTVDTHRKKILAKTKCSNFLELFKSMSAFQVV